MRGRKNGFHDVFGVELRRVTSILGRLKRYGMDEWQATCAIDFMMRELVLPLHKGWMTIEQLRETDLDRSREAAMEESRKRMKAARDRGHQVHAAINRYYKAAQDKRIITNTAVSEPELAAGLKAFLEWERLFRVDMVGTEKQVFSFRHGFAGTADLEAGVVLPAEDYGADAPVRHAVVDFKTGSPDPTTVIQLAAYAVALEEMNRAPMDCGIVVYLNADTGIPRWKIYTRVELEPAWIMFKTLKDFVELEDAWKKKEPDEGESPAHALPPHAGPPPANDGAGGSPEYF